MQINLWKPILLITALLIAVGVLAAKSYQPQDFAEAELQTARIEADILHQTEVYRLEETALENANANTFTRRMYWTLALSTGALAVMVAALVSAGGYSAVAVTYAVKVSLPQLAEAKKRYQAISNRPDFYELGDGRKVFETRGKRLLLLDQTGAVSLLDGTPARANPELVQIALAQIAAQVAIEQGKQRGRVEVIR